MHGAQLQRLPAVASSGEGSAGSTRAIQAVRLGCWLSRWLLIAGACVRGSLVAVAAPADGLGAARSRDCLPLLWWCWLASGHH